LALDGNTVRNSATPGGMDVKLFAALLHHEQVVIAQIAVPEDTTEVTCVPALLGPVDLRGKAVTMDAAHTQDAIADYLTRVRDADYIMTVKGNRPHLLDAIAARMPEPSRAAPIRPTSRPSVAGAQGIEFPGAVRVFRIRRQPYDLSGQRLSKEVVHGVTSLNPSQATPKQLLDAVRHHWRIEAMHWIRDVAYREDHQRAYTGTGAQVMAMIRNVALAVPRLTGHHEITRTLQRIAADRTRILPILATFPLPKPTCQQLCNWPEGEPMPCPRTKPNTLQLLECCARNPPIQSAKFRAKRNVQACGSRRETPGFSNGRRFSGTVTSGNVFASSSCTASGRSGWPHSSAGPSTPCSIATG
jgi:predicted transposase YbfD/YdcC